MALQASSYPPCSGTTCVWGRRAPPDPGALSHPGAPWAEHCLHPTRSLSRVLSRAAGPCQPGEKPEERWRLCRIPQGSRPREGSVPREQTRGEEGGPSEAPGSQGHDLRRAFPYRSPVPGIPMTFSNTDPGPATSVSLQSRGTLSHKKEKNPFPGDVPALLFENAGLQVLWSSAVHDGRTPALVED